MSKPLYLVDTNVFIRLEPGDLYDKDCFPNPYNLFINLIEEGKIISLDKVKEELQDNFFVNKYPKIFKKFSTLDTRETYQDLKVYFVMKLNVIMNIFIIGLIVT